MRSVKLHRQIFLTGLHTAVIVPHLFEKGYRYRLITSLLDPKKIPAKLLAAEYHQRWEVENTIDEFKVHLGERKTDIRSQRPREVVQEIYGLLLGHWAVRSLICQTAHRAEISPLSISFTGTLRVIRRAVPKFQRLEAQEIPFF